MKALAVFSDGTNHPLSGILKAGFKHCFVAVQTGRYWVVVDAHRGVPEIEVVADAGYDLAALYRGDGLTVIETEQTNKPSLMPIAHNNCVGLVKSVLGLRGIILTPNQLFRRLSHGRTS